jgi:uncharacterized protein (TIGR03083 family)
MDLPYDPLASLHSDGTAFIGLVAESDPTTSVPACPGWSLADLAYHQGEVWNFWGHVVANGITDRAMLRTIVVPPRVDHDQLAPWLSTTLASLHAALDSAADDQEVWTWTGANRASGWVRRRMAQEAAVHRHDAARAAGQHYEVLTSVAADGIDEFLTWFAGTERRDGELKPGGTVHLHCTDTTEHDVALGEWFVSSLKEPTCTFTREHRKADAAVRGRAHDVLMWLWRRSTEGIEVIGDEKVARRFRAYTALD